MLFLIKISSIEDWSRWLGRTRPCFIRGSTFFYWKRSLYKSELLKEMLWRNVLYLIVMYWWEIMEQRWELLIFLSDRGGFREWHGEPRAFSIFCNHLFFCNNFEELQTVLFEVELITNNAPSTYTYPNTIETCYTQSFVIW